MASVDKEFRELCAEISSKGREYEDRRRDVKRLQVPSFTFRHDLTKGFPAITNKKLPFKFVKGELIWFLRGDTNIKYLVDNKIPIWNKDAYNQYVKIVSLDTEKKQSNMYIWNDDTCRMFTIEEFIQSIRSSYSIAELKRHKSFGEYTLGDVGRNYSAQWRGFRGKATGINFETKEFVYERIDQIKELIADMKNDIMSSRLKVEAWNPSEINKTALPPCHDHFQVIGIPLNEQERLDILKVKHSQEPIGTHETVLEFLNRFNIPEFGFELHWNQRSVDTFLGLPFNIASYASLAEILAEVTGFPALAIEGTLKCVHFYDNQFEAVKELMSRSSETHSDCQFITDKDFKTLCSAFRKEVVDIDELFGEMNINMFKLQGYTSDEAIDVEMLAPKKI